MPHKLIMTDPPAAEPLSLEDVKLHLRVTSDGDDALIENLIAAARDACEAETGLSLVLRDYSLFLDRWPAQGDLGWWDGVREGAHTGAAGEIILPRPPLAYVTAVMLHDAAGDESEWPAGNYLVDSVGFPARLIPKGGAAPAGNLAAANGIEIRYTAGYGETPADIPPALRQGMLQMIAHLYEHRGDDTAAALSASGAQRLFRPFRVMGLA